MDSSSCAFSGHRMIHRAHAEILTSRLSEIIDDLIASGVTRFCSGGALGFDTLAAELVLKKKDAGAGVSLSMILPCRDQAKRWSASAVRTYERIISQADEVIYISDTYNQFCMHLRNRCLVNESDILLCYLVREASGTAYTKNFAEDMGRKIINIADLL